MTLIIEISSKQKKVQAPSVLKLELYGRIGYLIINIHQQVIFKGLNTVL